MTRQRTTEASPEIPGAGDIQRAATPKPQEDEPTISATFNEVITT
jgi:hypothetical protein